MCDASKGEKQLAATAKSFSAQMNDQATQVFGNDSAVFNNLMKAYSGTIASGPGQPGFTQNELDARNSAAITNNANQYRNVSGAVKNAQSAIGGGNTAMPSGFTEAQNLSVANAAAASTAGELNQIQQEDYAVGRDNYNRAVAGEANLPGVFSNVPGMDEAALKGQDAAMSDQKSLDAAAGWWKKPVMGLVNAGLSMATGGVSNVLAGSGNTFLAGMGGATGGNNGGNTDS